MTDILNKILAVKHKEVESAKILLPLVKLQKECTFAPAVRDFLGAITHHHTLGSPAIIAEIKKASPSKGIIREDFNPEALAKTYEKNHAACLSILTDEQFFQGSPQYLINARAACNLPVLRKDFIIDEYQIYQARLWGADAILLIAAALETEQMIRFEKIAHDLGMTVLVEVHNLAELEKTIILQTKLIGINNRNLKTFDVDLNITISLLPEIQNKIVVAESGITSKKEIQLLQEHGVNTFLIGETFMKEPDPGEALLNLYQ